MMNIEELKTKTEADISEYITKKSGDAANLL
ncbi:GnsA/GnsB family addiction module toxin, partial [Escherichia coli]